MNLHDTLLALQCASVVALFIESWIIFSNLNNPLHSYLLFSCVAVIINNLGYFFQMTAESEEGYLTALQIGYAGRVWIAFSLMLFIAKLCRMTIPKFIMVILVLIHLAIYASVLFLRKSSLFYDGYVFSKEGIFPHFSHGNGIVHHLFIFMSLCYISLGLFWLIREFMRLKNKNAKKRVMVVLFGITFQSVIFLIQTFKLLPITGYYDISSVGNMIGTVIMLFAIFGFRLLGTGEIAREFMIDRLSEAIIAVDNDGEIQYYNEPAVEIYPHLLTEKDRIIGEISEAVKNGANIEKKGHIYAPEENDLKKDGVLSGRVYSLADDTEHFEYMKKLEEQRAIADRANEAKSRFLASMSHEIRTPINAVLGMDEMILREAGEKNIRAYAADIMSAGKTLLSLINDILDLSKVEEGRMEIICVEYEISSLIDDLVNMIRDRAAKKGLKLELKADGHIPRILIGDETRIRQCVLNLLTNAVKYTEEGGVTLEVSHEKKDKDHVLLSFRVSDTGIGMLKEDMERLFSPYERLDAKRNYAIEGTGLGMTITRQLLELMGSRLEVQSTYNSGSSFSFVIEQSVADWNETGDMTERAQELKTGDYSYQELFRAPDARILVVDDTEMNLTVMQSLLKETKIRIDTALSGKDALMLNSGNEYDVLFIDIMMPGMDGIETLEKIREKGRNQKTPAVALTANAVSGARQEYIESGFDDYLSKPVEGEKLEKMLISLLPEDKIKRTQKTEVRPEKAEKERSRILAADDDEAVLELVRSIMGSLYDIRFCSRGKEVKAAAGEFQPDLILLDVHLGDMTGFKVLEELKADEKTSGIPVLLVTGDDDAQTEENAFLSGAADYVKKPLVPEVLKQRAKRLIALFHYQHFIEEEVEHQTLKSMRLSREMMFALSKAVDTKDHYTDGHSRRVAALSAELARRLGKSDREQVEIYEVGLMHDIGKIGIHEDIITKNSRLTDDEFLEIKEHTLKGYEILKEIRDMPKLCEGARWHHERFDGTGYPDGLKGEEIPEIARIVCVADVYDAMTSTRTYSKPKAREDVRSEFIRCSGSIFDPRVVRVMVDLIDEDEDFKINERAGAGDVWKEYKRLWENEGINEAGVTSEEGSLLPQWLSGVSRLDVNTGVKNCGNAEGYISVLSVFHKTAKDKASRIGEFYEKRDLENYTIMVHALKSSAGIIGAKELSLLAKKLEDAGKNEDLPFIEENTGELLRLYRELDSELSRLDDEDEDLPEISPEEMKEAYQTMAEIAGTYDYQLMEELLKDLKGYKLKEEDKSVINEIQELLTGLDFEAIAELAAKQ